MDAASPPRCTDHARLLIRRAQLALAGLAVPVAAMVGFAVESSAASVAPISAVRVALAANTPSAVSEPGQAAEIQPDTGPGPAQRPLGGLPAALITASICWTLLIGAGAVWRRRLAARDLREWDAGWERVEPGWSGRAG